MKKATSISFLIFTFTIFNSSSFRLKEPLSYISFYKERITGFKKEQTELLEQIHNMETCSGENAALIADKIQRIRLKLKAIDFWLRYLEPIVYKKINGPLPAEWETEVFEKYEPPYKREGAGLTLAENYLEEKEINKDSLEHLIRTSLHATDAFLHDSITRNLYTYHHFFLTNRLFLLNLAAIYTTGFECPDTKRIIPELRHLLNSVNELYAVYNRDFPNNKLSGEYMSLYEATISFAQQQPEDPAAFNHFDFIRKYVNPLYRLNHSMILAYSVRTSSFNDFSLNKYASSIFDKALYRGQNAKGVYIGITDKEQLNELKGAGRLLFYDPILSANNKRSCASCHKPSEYFTDTSVTAHLRFDRSGLLERNTPSLLNAVQNHLMMLDGKHYNLENQSKDVITNPTEMGSREEEVIKEVLSCAEYKDVFKKYLKETPLYNSINLEHIASALMLFYSDFSAYYSPFDNAMNEKESVSGDVVNGFNLFMSKAQCGTCHFVPQFNGVKPPYTNSEFEVIGVPSDTSFKKLSEDKGRYGIYPAGETHSAFRTGTIRNSSFTKPYMHNGVFRTLEEVIDFYDAGGGAGKGLAVNNQTLSSDPLKLTKKEKSDLIAFIKSLDEEIPVQKPPARLPVSKNKEINNRTVGGEY
jgi:cytochrome c peroxidase